MSLFNSKKFCEIAACVVVSLVSGSAAFAGLIVLTPGSAPYAANAGDVVSCQGPQYFRCSTNQVSTITMPPQFTYIGTLQPSVCAAYTLADQFCRTKVSFDVYDCDRSIVCQDSSGTQVDFSSCIPSQ